MMGHYLSDLDGFNDPPFGRRTVASDPNPGPAIGPLTDAFRKAADIEAETPIAGGAPITPELATAYAALIAHLRAEIDRQAAQLRAEQEHNRRLMAAGSLYRSAGVVGHTSLLSCDDDENGVSYQQERMEVLALLRRADDLAVPLASAP